MKRSFRIGVRLIAVEIWLGVTTVCVLAAIYGTSVAGDWISSQNSIAVLAGIGLFFLCFTGIPAIWLFSSYATKKIFSETRNEQGSDSGTPPFPHPPDDPSLN